MGSPALSLDKVNAMFLAYLERQTAEYVRNKCGVSWNTARKYIEDGDPARAVESFKARLRRVSKLSQRTFEERVAFSKGVGMANLWEQLADLDELISVSVERLKADLEKGEGKVRLTDIVKAISLGAELKVKLSKRVEQRRTITETVTQDTHTSQPDPNEEELGQFTPQELQAYINSDGQVVPAWFAGATASLPLPPGRAPAQEGSCEAAAAAGAPPNGTPAPGGDSRPVQPDTGSIQQTGSEPHPPQDVPADADERSDSHQHQHQPAATPAGPQQQPAAAPEDEPQVDQDASGPAATGEDTYTASVAEGEPTPSEIPEGTESWSEAGLDFPTWSPPLSSGEDPH